IGFPYRGFDYAWITWALASQLSESFSAGMSLQRAYSPNAYVNGLWGVTAGFSYRPNSHFGFAAVVHDFTGPSPDKVETLTSRGLPVLDRSYVLGMAFRPTGRRTLELGLDMKYLETTQQWQPRLTGGFDIPGVGRIRGDIEVSHLPNDDRRGVLATA